MGWVGRDLPSPSISVGASELELGFSQAFQHVGVVQAAVVSWVPMG